MANLSRDPKRPTWRRGFGWGWGWVIILGAIVFIVWIFSYGTGNYNANPAATANKTQQQQTQQPTQNAVPVTPPINGNVAAVNIVVHTPTPSEFVGQPANFENEVVQKVVSDNVFWIGPTSNEQMLVVMKEGAAPAAVKLGDRVDVTGTFQKMPDARQARQQWKLDRPVNWLQKQQLYVDAANVVNESNPQATKNSERKGPSR